MFTGYFRNRPTVRVIATKRSTNEVVEKDRSSNVMGSYDKTTTTTHEITRVLCEVDGELQVKEYNGHWDTKDLKAMEGK